MHDFLRNRFLPAVVGFAALLGVSTNTSAQYCAVSYTTGTSDGDYIDGVVLNTISNTGTGGEITGTGYSDYTALSTELTAGSSYSLDLTNTPAYGESYSAWIDYNQNDVFDASEALGTLSLLASGYGSIVFTVPPSATDGSTTMRVRCIYSGLYPMDPCANATWGEAEDYTIMISGGGAAIGGCMDAAALNYNPDADFDDGSCFYGYSYSSCDYDPLSTEGSVLCLGDDEVSSAVDLGFTFNFYGHPFTECYVGSNGFMTFNAGAGSACCTGQILPSAAYPNSIFFGQEDLDPNSCIDGTISYYTTGGAGDHIFVLSYTGVPHYPGPAGTFDVTTQVQLYESTGEVKIVTTNYNGDGGFSTMGLNMDGAVSNEVPGRNSTDWSAYDECVSFVPSDPDAEVCAIPTGLYADGITASGANLHWDAIAGANKYTVAFYKVSDAGTIRNRQYSVNYHTVTSSLAPSTTYGFRVKSVCHGLNAISDYSDWYYFTTLPGRIGQFEDENVSLFPNPNTGTFNLQLTGYENNVDVVVINSVGQIIYTNQLHVTSTDYTETITLKNAAPGIYQVRITNGEKTSVNSIVINK